jgi:Domain of unknown function (DUF3291)
MQHLAQLNIGRLRGGEDDAHMADFYAALDPVNALAERTPGFVWRLKSGDSNTAMTAPGDAAMAFNLTVWDSIEALERFVWQTVHARIYQRKGEWFEKPSQPHFVMWWIEAGHRPTAEEALERLAHLVEHGPSEHAFGWESAPAAKLWREKRCA